MSQHLENPIDPAGSTLESFFEESSQHDEVYGVAMKRVIAWQMEESRKAQHISKSQMALKMGTSRTQVDRVLAPDNVAVSLEVLAKAAHAVGKKLKVELIDANESIKI